MSLQDLRYDPPRCRVGHVESWFLQASDPGARRGIWLRWTVWAGERAPDFALAEAWAVAFGTGSGHVAVKSSIPFERARFAPGTLDVDVDGCRMTQERARGRIESGGRVIAYDLTVTPDGPPLALLPAAFMYARRWPWQKLMSPMPAARVAGRVEVQGESWIVEGWPARIGHNWGANHADTYAWGACNAWANGGDLLIEAAMARARIGPFSAPPTTLVGVRASVNGSPLTRVSSLVQLSRNTSTLSPRRWTFHARAADLDVAAEIWADTEDLVGLFYPNPDGTMCHCLGTTIARAEMTLRPHRGPPRVYRSERASFEIGTRDPHHGVRMYA